MPSGMTGMVTPGFIPGGSENNKPQVP